MAKRNKSDRAPSHFLGPPMPEQVLMTAGVTISWSCGMALIGRTLGGGSCEVAVPVALLGITTALASFACEFGADRSRHRFYGSVAVVLASEGALLEHARPGAVVDHLGASVAVSLLLGAGLTLLALGSSVREDHGGPAWRWRPTLATFGTVAAVLGTPFVQWGWKVLM